MNHVQFTRSCIIWIHSVVSAPPLLRETNGEKSRLGLKTARHGARAAVLLGKLPRELPKIRPHRFGGEGVLIGGQNSNTKCSMTFVNIAVAISALAGGGQKRFRTETRIRWCFRHFSRIFGCLSARGYWNGILGHFGSFPAMEKRPKMKKTLYIARLCRVFGCQSIENTAKTSVLDWRYSKKRVNYRMLDWKHYKNTVKSNVLEGFTAFMAKNV